MEQKGELISYRPDIKVVDCTIRDGGLVNNFYFDDEFVRNLYTANVAAGVLVVEHALVGEITGLAVGACPSGRQGDYCGVGA